MHRYRIVIFNFVVFTFSQQRHYIRQKPINTVCTHSKTHGYNGKYLLRSDDAAYGTSRFVYQGAVLLTVGRSYVGNYVTHSTLLDRACACSYENLPKYRSYRISNTAPRTFQGSPTDCDTEMERKKKNYAKNVSASCCR